MVVGSLTVYHFYFYLNLLNILGKFDEHVSKNSQVYDFLFCHSIVEYYLFESNPLKNNNDYLSNCWFFK
jgi:CRISPR-associated protein Cas8b1/Cst1 subtype I-B